MSNVVPLRPARPEPEGDKPGYMPKLPWRWIGGLGTFFVCSVALYQLRERQEADALRDEIVRAHRTALGPIVSRYETLMGKIHGWTAAASQTATVEDYVDPRLNLDNLHKGKGLVMRLSAQDGRTPEGITRGLEAAGPEAITRCLGLAPAQVGELVARGSFLTSKWIEQANHADDVMKLRVIAEELKQRSTRDLPFVANALYSDWFMLALERGENRRDAPVDMYLYDLRANKLLLRSRVKAAGALVAARIAVAGVKPGAYATGAQTGAAQDCAIASRLRELTGRQAASFGAEPPEPRKAIGGATAPLSAPPAPTKP